MSNFFAMHTIGMRVECRKGYGWYGWLKRMKFLFESLTYGATQIILVLTNMFTRQIFALKHILFKFTPSLDQLIDIFPSVS